MSAPKKCNQHISILKHFEATPDEEGKMKITNQFQKNEWENRKANIIIKIVGHS